MIILALFSIIVGGLVGLAGANLNWSLFKTSFVAVVVGLMLGLISRLANADEPVPIAIQKLRISTVRLSNGSGSIVEGASGNHYLLTNFHVCTSSSYGGKVHANYPDGSLIGGKIFKESAPADLCAVKVTRAFPALKLSKQLYPTTQLYTRGYPFGVLSETAGFMKSRMTWSYTYPLENLGTCPKGSKGELNVLGHLGGCTVSYTDNLTNMYSRPGSSGSPVVDSSGDIVGVMSSWFPDQDAGGMVTLETLSEFLNTL